MHDYVLITGFPLKEHSILRALYGAIPCVLDWILWEFAWGFDRVFAVRLGDGLVGIKFGSGDLLIFKRKEKFAKICLMVFVDREGCYSRFLLIIELGEICFGK